MHFRVGRATRYGRAKEFAHVACRALGWSSAIHIFFSVSFFSRLARAMLPRWFSTICQHLFFCRFLKFFNTLLKNLRLRNIGRFDLGQVVRATCGLLQFYSSSSAGAPALCDDLEQRLGNKRQAVEQKLEAPSLRETNSQPIWKTC